MLRRKALASLHLGDTLRYKLRVQILRFSFGTLIRPKVNPHRFMVKPVSQLINSEELPTLSQRVDQGKGTLVSQPDSLELVEATVASVSFVGFALSSTRKRWIMAPPGVKGRLWVLVLDVLKNKPRLSKSVVEVMGRILVSFGDFPTYLGSMSFFLQSELVEKITSVS